jgi:Fe-S-cluster containining protein
MRLAHARIVADNPAMPSTHPCLSCGACCAAFVVAFHWSETEAGADSTGLPAEFTERLDAHRLAMRGTWAKRPHCAALRGGVGVETHCMVYPRRPSPCRELQAAWEHGEPSPQCDRARAMHGLRPLAPGGWR